MYDSEDFKVEELSMIENKAASVEVFNAVYCSSLVVPTQICCETVFSGSRFLFYYSTLFNEPWLCETKKMVPLI